MRSVAERTLEVVTVRRATAALLAAIGALALVGGLVIALDLDSAGPVQESSNLLQWFDLNKELSVPAYFSSLMLAAIAGLALYIAWTPGVRHGGATPWLGMAMIVSVLAFDEVVDLHGRLQRTTDIEAQVLFAPLILLAAVVGLILLRWIWPLHRVRALFIGGAVAWGMAMAIDPGTHPGSVRAFPEETLEMLGSAVFVLALLMLARGDADAQAGDVTRRTRLRREQLAAIADAWDSAALGHPSKRAQAHGRATLPAPTGENTGPVVGGAGPDHLRSGSGGRDCLIGNRGSDRLHAVDGRRDMVSCGRGDDVAIVDRQGPCPRL